MTEASGIDIGHHLSEGLVYLRVMKKSHSETVDGFDMDFRPRDLLRGVGRLAAIVGKLPEEMVEELDEDSSGPMRWTDEAFCRVAERRTTGLSALEWHELRARVRKQEARDLGVLEESVAGIASNPAGCMISCPCELIARFEEGKVVLVQRYDRDWDHEDSELGRYDTAPSFGEVVRLVGLILNDPEWLDGEIRPTWQESLAIQEGEQPAGWELSVGSRLYPRLGEWFEKEWRGVLQGTKSRP